MNECQVTGGKFFIARRQTAEVLELAEPVFDLVASAVEPARAARWLYPVLSRGDHALDTVAGQLGTQVVSIVATIGGQPSQRARLLRLGVDFIKSDKIVPLTGSQGQGHGGMFIDAGGMHLDRQSAARATKSLVNAVFFGAPAAWGWAGMLVLSTNTSRSAGVAPRESTSHNRRHTPAFSQRRKRMYTALQAPNSSGKSLQGKPVRVRYSTASTNSRSSKPGGAPLGSFTSASAAASCSHIALVSNRRAMPTVYPIPGLVHRLFVNTL